MNKKDHITSDKPDDDLRKKIIKYWTIPKKDLVPPSRDIVNASKRNDVNHAKLRTLVNEHAEKLTDAEGIMELLPDLQLVKETLVSSILSPKDLKEVSLNITIDKGAPPEIAEVIRTHFTTVFDLGSKLATILGQALFDKGSYVLLTIPPSVVSELITKNTYGLEDNSVKAEFKLPDTQTLGNIGLLKGGTRPMYAMEGFYSEVIKEQPTNIGLESLIEITDNVKHLLVPCIRSEIRQLNTDRILTKAYGLEALPASKNVADKKDSANIYNRTSVKQAVMVVLDSTADVEEKLNPVVLTLPQESVVRVYLPGEPENTIGCYIFLDDNGNPITYNTSSNKFKELNNRLNDKVNEQALSSIVNVGVAYNSSTTQRNNTKAVIDHTLMQAYYVQFENNLKDAVGNGVADCSVEIGNPGELYRIMLFRQLERQRTKIVYVPAKYINYFAFNYDETGTGISLLEKTKLYASFRAILMFATVMAAIKASVNKSILSVTLDEEEPDPAGTIETILNEYALLQTSGMPIGRINPVDIVNSIQQAGIQLKVNGGTKYPNTDIDVTEHKKEITPPSDEIMDMLKKIHYAGLWVNVETIDSSADAEYATSITSANLFQSKRVQQCQTSYINQLSAFIQQYIRLGGPLLSEIQEKYNEFGESCQLELSEIIDSISVLLPKPDTAVITAQIADYTAYSDLITLAIDAYISEEEIKDQLRGNNIPANIADIKQAAINILKRQYMRSENILPELDALLANNESNLSEVLGDHNKALIKIIGKVLRTTKAAENEDDLLTKEVEDKLTPIEGIADGADDSSNDESADDGGMDYDESPDDNGGDVTEFETEEDDTTESEAEVDTDTVEDTDTTADDTDTAEPVSNEDEEPMDATTEPVEEIEEEESTEDEPEETNDNVNTEGEASEEVEEDNTTSDSVQEETSVDEADASDVNQPEEIDLPAKTPESDKEDDTSMDEEDDSEEITGDDSTQTDTFEDHESYLDEIIEDSEEYNALTEKEKITWAERKKAKAEKEVEVDDEDK